MRVLIVCPDRNPVGGVRQHCLRLAEQLSAAGDSITVTDLADAVKHGKVDVVHLHYVPFAFGHYGMSAIPLARQLARLGRLVVTVHEPRTRFRLSRREALLAPWQSVPMRYVSSIAHQVVIPTNRWAALFTTSRASVIPAGSALRPDVLPDADVATRQPLRVGLIYSGHGGRGHDLALRAALHLRDALGAVPICLGGEESGIESTGAVDVDTFGAEMRRCGMILLPYSDGVSGRRTSFMSALQVGASIVTTTGPGKTDFVLDDAVAWSAAGCPEEFIDLSSSVAANDRLRTALSQGAASLFSADLQWPMLARRHSNVYHAALA